MTTCLITGATGLVGSRLTTLLRDVDVIAVAREKRSGDATFIPLDLASDWSPSRLPQKLDAVVHLAQAENYRDFPGAADSIFRVNTASTVKLLDHARRSGATTFVLASTGGVYGSSERAFTEDDVPAVDAFTSGEKSDLAFYLRTRRASECLASAFRPWMNVVVLRFFFVYGAGQKEAMLIPRLVRCVRSGSPIILQGRDGLRLNPIHVDDAAKAVAAALQLRASEILNIAGPEVLTLRAVGEAIGRALGRAPVFESQPGAPANLVGDIAKMTRVVGAPSTRFAEGVRFIS